MTSAEHLARDFSLQTRGIHVLAWDNKVELVRALLILQAAVPAFPASPILVPTAQRDLQRLGLLLFEASDAATNVSLRVFLIPQASTEAVGAWLNGWRRRLVDTPGTLIVVRSSDLMAFYRRAPDLMSFAQAEIYEAAGLLPLVTKGTLDNVRENLPNGWEEPLKALPGPMPSDTEIRDWLGMLRANLE